MAKMKPIPPEILVGPEPPGNRERAGFTDIPIPDKVECSPDRQTWQVIEEGALYPTGTCYLKRTRIVNVDENIVEEIVTEYKREGGEWRLIREDRAILKAEKPARVSPWSNKPGVAMKPLSLDDMRQALGIEPPKPEPMSGTQVVSSASRGRFVNDNKFDINWDLAPGVDATFVLRMDSAKMDIAKLLEAVKKLEKGRGDIKAERKPFVEKPRARLIGDEE